MSRTDSVSPVRLPERARVLHHLHPGCLAGGVGNPTDWGLGGSGHCHGNAVSGSSSKEIIRQACQYLYIIW